MATSETTTVLIFYADDDKDGTRRARMLSAGLTRAGWECRLVNKLGNKLVDLQTVAEHRAIDVPMWLVLRDDVVILRMHGIPSTREAATLLQACAASPAAVHMQ